MTNGYQALNQADWAVTTDVDRLSQIENPSLGNRHLPICHGEALQMFHDKAITKGLNIKSQVGFLSPEQDRYIYVAETKHTNGEAYGLGFVNFNDRTRSFVGLASQKVFVCSNLCFGGVFQPSRTRHTLNVGDRLDDKMNTIFNQYDGYVNRMQDSVEFLKNREIDDAIMGKVLIELHRKKVMGSANITRIITEYDDPTFNSKDEGKNGWRLFNAMTHTLKNIKNPIQNIDTSFVGRKLILETLGY